MSAPGGPPRAAGLRPSLPPVQLWGHGLKLGVEGLDEARSVGVTIEIETAIASRRGFAGDERHAGHGLARRAAKHRQAQAQPRWRPDQTEFDDADLTAPIAAQRLPPEKL